MPRAWIQRMKASMKLLSPVFSTNRMVGEYAERYYLPTAAAYERVSADRFQVARDLAAWKSRIDAGWPHVAVEQVLGIDGDRRTVGDTVPVTCVVRLGALPPSDVAVEASVGPVDPNRLIVSATVVPMRHVETLADGRHRYAGELACGQSGLLGYTVRVRPSHPHASNAFATGLMTWA
jgi:starch phosphorylase